MSRTSPSWHIAHNAASESLAKAIFGDDDSIQLVLDENVGPSGWEYRITDQPTSGQEPS